MPRIDAQPAGTAFRREPHDLTGSLEPALNQAGAATAAQYFWRRRAAPSRAEPSASHIQRFAFRGLCLGGMGVGAFPAGMTTWILERGTRDFAPATPGRRGDEG
ncbi:MAG: hypothetical protein U0531_14920 [Dehalococcoidia bacterium]